MATQTLLVGTVADESGEARLEVDYDDTSTPTNWTLIRGRVVNQMARAVFIDIQRGNGASFWTTTVAAGQTTTKNAGGPVQRQADIPYMLLRTT